MNDAITLLAVSQLISLGGVAFLYRQVQSLRRSTARPRVGAAVRNPVMQVPPALVSPPAGFALGEDQALLTRAARNAYAPPAPHPAATPPSQAPAPANGTSAQLRFDSGAIAARMTELGVDVPALARRMRRSEAEVQALLGRRTTAR